MLQHGSVFAGDLARMLGAAGVEISHALWELVAAGLATADGFDPLRMLIDPRRKLSLQSGGERRLREEWQADAGVCWDCRKAMSLLTHNGRPHFAKSRLNRHAVCCWRAMALCFAMRCRGVDDSTLA